MEREKERKMNLFGDNIQIVTISNKEPTQATATGAEINIQYL